MQVLRALLALGLALARGSRLVDNDTPAAQRITVSRSNNNLDYVLVFSDEFNGAGRAFGGESDPHWEAYTAPDPNPEAIQFYNGSAEFVTTKDGSLVLRLSQRKARWRGWDADERRMRPFQRNYTSGMVSTWNRFCFTGGIVEMSVQLPGDAHGGGLWPAAWLLGNLARPLRPRSSERVWPWSYDACPAGWDATSGGQEISACDPQEGDAARRSGLNAHQGRGAPEIDIFEALPSYAPSLAPNMTATLTVSPGVERGRPAPGAAPNGSAGDNWYRGLRYGAHAAANVEFYGRRAGGVGGRTYEADAISARAVLGTEHFDGQQVYRVEWQPGPLGYVRWYVNGKFVFGVSAASLRNATGAMIPEEPMQLVLNLAMSNYWAMQRPCEDGCDTCYACLDCENALCQCGLPPQLEGCAGLPVEMRVDYVRVYQDPKDALHTLGCSPPSHPTAAFIHENMERYAPWEPEARPPLSTANKLLILLATVALLAAALLAANRALYGPKRASANYLPGADSPSAGRGAAAWPWGPMGLSRLADMRRVSAVGRCLGWYHRIDSQQRVGWESPRPIAEEERLVQRAIDYGARSDWRGATGGSYTSLADMMRHSGHT